MAGDEWAATAAAAAGGAGAELAAGAMMGARSAGLAPIILARMSMRTAFCWSARAACACCAAACCETRSASWLDEVLC